MLKTSSSFKIILRFTEESLYAPLPCEIDLIASFRRENRQRKGKVESF